MEVKHSINEYELAIESTKFQPDRQYLIKCTNKSGNVYINAYALSVIKEKNKIFELYPKMLDFLFTTEKPTITINDKGLMVVKWTLLMPCNEQTDVVFLLQRQRD